MVLFTPALLYCFLLADTEMPLLCLIEQLVFEPLERNTVLWMSCNIGNHYSSYWHLYSPMSSSDPVPHYLILTSSFPCLISKCYHCAGTFFLFLHCLQTLKTAFYLFIVLFQPLKVWQDINQLLLPYLLPFIPALADTTGAGLKVSVDRSFPVFP